MSVVSLFLHRRHHGAVIVSAFALIQTFSGGYSVPCFAQSVSAGPIIEETFVLKYLKPSALVTFLAEGNKSAPAAKPGAKRTYASSPLLPDSIKSVTPDDVFNTVTVRGASDAIVTIRKLALLLDVPPQPVRLNLRIIRYRTAASQKAAGSGAAPLADVEEVASGVVETPSNTPVEVTTFGDRHTFRARLKPHANSTDSVTIAADLQIATLEGSFRAFSTEPSGTRLLRIGDRGLITSAGSGISSASLAAKPADGNTAKIPEESAPETYYLEVTPSFPAAAADKK